jgi:hypothetical protein
VRIAVSSSTFRQPLAAGELTQLEWLEHCANVLTVDGVLAGVADFPRTDAEYVAQLRKVAVDLGIVPFGIDAAGLFDHDSAFAGDDVIALASGFGAAVVRTTLPPPGEVPPATFVETVKAAKALGRIAKVANVTVVLAPAPGTIGADLAAVKHLLKDTDSAWLRACPGALDDSEKLGARDRIPAFAANAADDPAAVAARVRRGWTILDAPPAKLPFDVVGRAVAGLRKADAEQTLAGR